MYSVHASWLHQGKHPLFLYSKPIQTLSFQRLRRFIINPTRWQHWVHILHRTDHTANSPLRSNQIFQKVRNLSGQSSEIYIIIRTNNNHYYLCIGTLLCCMSAYHMEWMTYNCVYQAMGPTQRVPNLWSTVVLMYIYSATCSFRWTL